MAKIFDISEFKNIYQPHKNSSGEDNGQVTIIGGSELFHGAPILALKAASRMVDMVFFASPDKSVGMVAEHLKSQLASFIWVPWQDVENYVRKSDAVLIGPGFMRFGSEKTTGNGRVIECDGTCQITKNITRDLLKKFPRKRWVIDAGSLQTMEAEWIPKGAIITPNRKEFEMLFNLNNQNLKTKMTKGTEEFKDLIREMSSKHKCIIVLKGPVTLVSDGKEVVEVHGGNAGMTKGGTGDTMAGLTVALLAKNNPFLAAKAAAYVVKAAGDDLYRKKGVYYNADDLAENVTQALYKLTAGR